MNAEEAVAYIHSQHWQQHAPGLSRMRALLAALGNPQQELRFVHVAGTNGKGSTCACIASVLHAAGFRVGLNTSPFLMRFNERVQVNGEEIPDEELAVLMEEIRPAAEAMSETPTEFELITALAFLYFQRQRCDIVVLEVGMGGALDASNVIDAPEVAVITAMGMDHVKELGPTMADIAAAKAGIIKPCGRVVSYGGVPEADRVIWETCIRQNATLTEAAFDRLGNLRCDLSGSTFDFAPFHGLRLPLVGTYQPKNAAVAVTVLEELRCAGWAIPDEAIVRGLACVRWPGRFEVLRREPTILLDGAHNAHGLRATTEALRTLFPGRKFIFLLGIMADKDVEQMLDLLTPLAEQVVTVRPDSPRALDAQVLRELLAARGIPAQAAAAVPDGVETAVCLAGKSGVVCALGSLYFSGDVRRAVEALGRTGRTDPLSIQDQTPSAGNYEGI